VRERTGLRVFRIKADRYTLFVDASINFYLASAGARALCIMAKQNTENPEQGVFKIYRLRRLLSQIVGALRSLHVPLDYRA
jgi:hypothetical protein